MKNRSPTHRQPNLVFITSHDTGRHLGCYGIRQVATPNLDRLAAEGVRFDNFFCTSPVCSPSRGAMMSGFYPQTNGLMGLVHSPYNWAYHPRVKHLSQILQGHGYHTALFHHQHEVMPDQVEKRLGFDEYLVRQDTGVAPLDVGRKFAEFLAGHPGNRPFYAQIGFGLTHRNWKSDQTEKYDKHGIHVPPYLKNNEAAREDLAWLQGAVNHLDRAVGVILDAIRHSRFTDNTIVIFTVDHGIEVPRAKWTLYDPGIEVAFIMKWPAGGIRGGKVAKQLLSNVDVTPTLLELMGLKGPAGMQGKSFAGVCRNPRHAPVRDAIFAEFVQSSNPEARCVRTNRHKLIRNFSNHRLLKVPVDIARQERLVDRVDHAKDDSYCPVVQLYDLAKDPLETDNLAGKPKHVKLEKELDRKLWQWMEDVKDPLLKGPLPMPIYQRAMADYRKRR